MAAAEERAAVSTVSVVMPVHDGEAFLQTTLASLGADADGSVEAIILDSSAGDTCGAHVRDFEKTHAHRIKVRYEHCPDVRSWTEKTNLAAKRATAPWIAMLHQDDLWLPGRLAALRAATEKAPDAALIVTPAHIIDAGGKRLGQWRSPFPPGSPQHTDACRERLLVQNSIALPSALVSRKAWDRVGGLDETLWYTPDWDLWLKLLTVGPLVPLDEPTAAFRVHPNSQTVVGSRDASDFRQQMEIVLSRHLPLVPAERRPRVEAAARTSIAVNCALASAASGQVGALRHAAGAFLRLPPWRWRVFMRDTRLLERVWPRMRAQLLTTA